MKMFVQVDTGSQAKGPNYKVFKAKQLILVPDRGVIDSSGEVVELEEGEGVHVKVHGDVIKFVY